MIDFVGVGGGGIVARGNFNAYEACNTLKASTPSTISSVSRLSVDMNEEHDHTHSPAAQR